MKLPIYQVDAFTTELFGGNPAAVCPLEKWLPDAVLQRIAAENNVSETAFFVGSAPHFSLRWFTPTVEVDLCGHATLATAYVISRHLAPSAPILHFDTRSGALRVRTEAGRLTLDFPATVAQIVASGDARLGEALGVEPTRVLRGRHNVAVFDDEATVQHLDPDFGRVAELGLDGTIATAPGDDVDFVSRFFAPHQGIPEDPVTGSAHCTLAPYWSSVLGRTTLSARQLSARGGVLECTVRGDRVEIEGSCVPYMEGTITLPDG